jgi:hypothetical protein
MLKAMLFSAALVAGLMAGPAAQAIVPSINQVVESECGAAKETAPRAGGMSIVQICQAVLMVGAPTVLEIGAPAADPLPQRVMVVHQSSVTGRGVVKRVSVWQVSVVDVTTTRRGTQNEKVELLEMGTVDSYGIYQPKLSADYVTGKLSVSSKNGETKTIRGEIDGVKVRASKFEWIFTPQIL